jgi:MinD-like ATPase involved in chromosome partitioning or flagellar assembly
MLQGFRKQGSITVGRYPKMSRKEAKLRVKALAGEVVNHVDPVEAKAERVAKAKAKVAAAPAPVPVSKVPTMRQVAENFYKAHIMVENQPSTQAIQRYTFDAKVFPELGDLPIDQVDRRVISKFLDSLSSGPDLRQRRR